MTRLIRGRKSIRLTQNILNYNFINFNLSFFKLFFFRVKIRIGDFNHASTADDRFAIIVEIQNTDIQKHPQFDGITAHFDVAVLTTEKIEFSSSIFPVCLPTTKFTYVSEYDERSAQLIGWGSKVTTGQNSARLKRVGLTVFPNR